MRYSAARRFLAPIRIVPCTRAPPSAARDYWAEQLANAAFGNFIASGASKPPLSSPQSIAGLTTMPDSGERDACAMATRVGAEAAQAESAAASATAVIAKSLVVM
jgi:hypothetical protein